MSIQISPNKVLQLFETHHIPLCAPLKVSFFEEKIHETFHNSIKGLFGCLLKDPYLNEEIV